MKNSALPRNICIIGAGIVGASIAFHLARRGARLTVLDRGDPGQGASSVSFAWINARDKNPRNYQDLNRRSLDMWDGFARLLGRDIGLVWGGELRWATTPDGARVLEERVRLLQSWGYPIRLLNDEEMQKLEPGLNPGRVAAVSYSPADGHVDAGSVIQACLSQAGKLGATVFPGTAVTGLEFTAEKGQPKIISAVRAGERSLPCDAVVLAAGADSPAIAAMAGVELPLSHTFGATIVTGPVRSLLKSTAVIHSPPDHETQIALRQLGDGSVMLHGGDGGTPGESLGKSEVEVQRILDTASLYFPVLQNVEIKEVRSGRRPMPRDGQSILGFTSPVPNLYIAATHSGVTLAPLIGTFAALEILEGAQIDLLAPFRLERFSVAGE